MTLDKGGWIRGCRSWSGRKKPSIYMIPRTWIWITYEEGKIIASRSDRSRTRGAIRPMLKSLKSAVRLVATTSLSLTKAKQRLSLTQHTSLFLIWPNAGLNKQLRVGSPEQNRPLDSGEIQQFVKDYKVKRSLWKSTRRQRWQIVSLKQQGACQIKGVFRKPDPQNDKDLLENLERKYGDFSQGIRRSKSE